MHICSYVLSMLTFGVVSSTPTVISITL